MSRRQVQDYRAQALEALNAYRGIEADLRKKADAHANLPYWLTTLDYGRAYQEAMVAWCDRTLKRLKG